MDFIIVKKEEIAGLHFLPKDVLSSPEDKFCRLQKLRIAVKLGNTEKHECKIMFKAVEGEKAVEDVVWSITENYIILKGNVILLISAVFEIIL